MMNIGYVYLITSPSNRLYIGSTSNLKKRIYSYSNLNCKTQTKLYNSLKKYGWENHTFEVIWEGFINEMLKNETLLGLEYDVLNIKNLNLKLPKIGDNRKITSDETKNKMSNSAMGRVFSEESKIKIKENNKNKLKSLKTKKNMSITQKKRPIYLNAISAISKANINNKYNLDKIHSKDEIEKMSKSKMKAIIQMDLEGNFIKEWDSIKDASTTLNISRSSITLCCQGSNRYSHAGSFKWKYKLEYYV